MGSLSLAQLGPMVSQFLHRFHIILFVVLVVGGLSLVTLFLNQAISKPASDTSPSPTQSFDETTMAKIKNLRTTDDQSNLVLPSGRIDPFTK